jgi:hypothetical protein
LVRGRPAQDQRGRLCRVNAHRHAGHVVRAERAIIGVGPDHRHVGHSVANLKFAHAIAKLIDLPDHVIAHHERRPEAHRLRVQVAPDQDLSVIEARGEYTDPHLAPAGGRQRRVDHLQTLGITEAVDLNNPIARLNHGHSPCNLVIRRKDRHSFAATVPAVSLPVMKASSLAQISQPDVDQSRAKPSVRYCALMRSADEL